MQLLPWRRCIAPRLLLKRRRRCERYVKTSRRGSYLPRRLVPQTIVDDLRDTTLLSGDDEHVGVDMNLRHVDPAMVDGKAGITIAGAVRNERGG
jgi:hypothetical protein